MNVKKVGERAPHINYDIMIHPNAGGAMSQTNFAKRTAKAVDANDYGMKSLYRNEMTNFMDAMHISGKKAAQRGGPGGYGCNAPFSQSAIGHGDPLWRRTGHVGAEMPSLQELQKQYPSLTKDKYE